MNSYRHIPEKPKRENDFWLGSRGAGALGKATPEDI